jgi:FKBP-type peptidyl-prolyl cis-trans isomerase
MRVKILVLWVLALVSVGLTSCIKSVDSEDEAKIEENDKVLKEYLISVEKITNPTQEPAGYYFLKRVSNPLGDSAKLGDAATVAIKGYLFNGGAAVTSDTVSFPVGGNTLIYGLELGIRKVRTGEKAALFLPYYLAFGNTARTNIPAYSPIRMEMEFIKTRTEIQQINDYLVKKKFVVTERTPENLVIVRTDTLTAAPVGAGKAVTVKYVGRFLDDTKFDEGSFALNTGAGSVITGFDQAVQKLPFKGKAIAIFPSPLGYKASGNNTIPPYSPLVFELEIQ